MRCNAKAKHSQVQCRSRAVTGSAKCYMHGGKSLRGVASATYKTGRYSKDMPTRLAARYNASLDDPALLALRDEISVVDSRISDLLKRVDSGESGMLWYGLKKALESFKVARSFGDTEAMREGLAQIEGFIDQGAADHAAWDEVYDAIEQRRKLTETEHKHLVAAQQLISVERANILLGALLESIRREVTTHAEPTAARAILVAVSQEFRRYTE